MMDDRYDDDGAETGPGPINWKMWALVACVMAFGWACALFGSLLLKPWLMVLTSN